MTLPDAKVLDIQPMRMAGRCSNGAEADGGTRWHAVERGGRRAVCGAEPGRRSVGWSEHLGTAVTCPRCLSKLARAAEARVELIGGNHA